MNKLRKSKARLETELGGRSDMLAWPFGIDEEYSKAGKAGDVENYTFDRRQATAADSVMKLPRYRLVNADSGKTFVHLLEGNAGKRKVVY